MKKTKKLICLVSSLLMATSACLGSCGPAEVTGDTSTLTISFWKCGWGDEYIKTVIADFETAHPEYTVELQSSTDGFVYQNTIELGATMNDIDLYIGSFMATPYDENAESLNSLLNEKCEGDNVTVGDKLGETYREGMKYRDGNIYGLPEPFTTYSSIVYNADMIGEGTDYAIPVTTDELEALVSDLSYDDNFKNVKPFIHYGQGDYWKYVYQQWWVQYAGIDNYYDFLRLNDATDETVAPSLLEKDGRYYSLQVLDTLLSSDTVYAGSNNLQYQQAQTLFMNGSAVMMANGGWLVNEMKANTEASASNLRMMRTPVISAIANKCDSISDDEELAACIRKMDIDVASGRKDGLNGEGFSVTQEDYDRIYEARYCSNPGYDASLMVIPEYSTAKDAAKAFVKFYYSDAEVAKVLNILHQPTSLSACNISIDRSNWLPFEKDIWDLQSKTITVLGEAVGIKNELFTYGGLNVWGTRSPIVAFTQTERYDLDSYWTELVSYYGDTWKNAVKNVKARA